MLDLSKIRQKMVEEISVSQHVLRVKNASLLSQRMLDPRVASPGLFCKLIDEFLILLTVGYWVTNTDSREMTLFFPKPLPEFQPPNVPL